MTVDWYVLRSKPRKEDFLYGQLLSRKIKAYYPKIRAKPVNPRSRKIKPYFPGYVFIHVDLAEIDTSSLQWMPGSVGLVSFGKEPSWVPDSVVSAIRKQVERINLAGGETLAQLQSGDEVVVQSGPFAGYKAIFDTSLSGNERVLVLLQLLENQNMRLELPAKQIKKRKK